MASSPKKFNQPAEAAVTHPSDPSPAGDSTEVVGPKRSWSGWLSQHRWVGFVVPFVVYMLAGQLEQPRAVPQSAAPVASDDQSDPFADDQSDTPSSDGFIATDAEPPPILSYPLAYALRISLTLASMVLVWPVYRQFEFRVSGLAVAVGVVGAPLWIGLSHLQRNFAFLPESIAAWIGAARAGYDPLAELGDRPAMLAGFLAVRFLGLALIVPVIEEFFLRGFLARFVAEADWWKVPIGVAGGSSIAAIVAYAALSHPSELLAAVAWFLLVTWLIARSKNIWDAVLAHATTNLLLGMWVLATKQFWLW